MESIDPSCRNSAETDYILAVASTCRRVDRHNDLLSIPIYRNLPLEAIAVSYVVLLAERFCSRCLSLVVELALIENTFALDSELHLDLVSRNLCEFECTVHLLAEEGSCSLVRLSYDCERLCCLSRSLFNECLTYEYEVLSILVECYVLKSDLIRLVRVLNDVHISFSLFNNCRFAIKDAYVLLETSVTSGVTASGFSPTTNVTPVSVIVM